MNDSNTLHDAGTDLPRAKVGKDWKTHFFWIVPIAAALLAAYFIYTNTKKGPKIHIYFSDATRLEARKSAVEYRGATVGQVESIELTPDQKQVKVTVELKKSAANLAKQNSKFWIVRAQIGAAKITGLGTIVSGDFITVEPGDGKPQTDFQGLGEAPVETKSGTLHVELLAERLDSLGERTPVFYRGIQIGQVAKCDLGPQAQTVQAMLDIDGRYAPLVRMNSVFWRAGGINMNIGLNGADISAQSFKTLVSGGIDLATPDTTQKQAPPGTSFRLYEKPQDKWLGWSPAIDIPSGPTTRPAAATSGGGVP